MIPPDDVNPQQKTYGHVSRRWIYLQRHRDFWATYQQDKPGLLTLNPRQWKRKRRRLLNWHKDTKLAPYIRDGKNLLLIYKEFYMAGNF